MLIYRESTISDSSVMLPNSFYWPVFSVGCFIMAPMYITTAHANDSSIPPYYLFVHIIASTTFFLSFFLCLP